MPFFPYSVEEFERLMCRITMNDLLSDIETWRVDTELPDYWGGCGGVCKAIKHLLVIVEFVRGMRNDARADDLQAVADNFACGAMLT